MTAWLWILGAVLWTAIIATAWISIASTRTGRSERAGDLANRMSKPLGQDRP